MDARVIDSPAFIRAMVVHLTILPFRPKRTAEAYRQIWRQDESPLLLMSSRQCDLVQAEVETTVALAMRYGSPSISEVVAGLVEDGVEELFIMPLYPQYAMSSYETVVVRVSEEIQRLKPSMGTTLLQPFYDNRGPRPGHMTPLPVRISQFHRAFANRVRRIFQIDA